MPVDVKYLDYEPLGFLSWSLRQDGELIEQRAFGSNATGNDIFAFYTLDDERLRADFTYPWVIVGAIRPTSAMEIGPAGFCCGDAEIVALARSPLWRDDEKRAAETTAQRYGVPLVEFDRLAAVASEHGNAVPEDDRLPAQPEPRPRPRLRGQRQTSTGNRPPLDDSLRGEAESPENIDPCKNASGAEGSMPAASAAVSSAPSTAPRAPPRPSSGSLTEAAAHRWRERARLEPSVRGMTDSLGWLAFGAALVALGAGVWLLARAGWPAGSLPFLLPAAVVIAVVADSRLQIAFSGAIGGAVAGALYLLVASGSGHTTEEGQVQFALLVVAWFSTLTAFTCAAAAASSPADRSLRERLFAVATLVLPVVALLAVGLLNLPAGLGAMVVAVVELAGLFLWRQAVGGESDRSMG